jgi:hypothetical protein
MHTLKKVGGKSIPKKGEFGLIRLSYLESKGGGEL